MARARDLPILGGLALIGAGAGLHLGWSAIGEINPVYFSRAHPASSFHGDLGPNRSYDSGPQMPSIEQAGTRAPGTGCVGCRPYPEEYRPVPDPAIEQLYAPARERAASISVELAAYGHEPPEQAARRKADLERVELYSRAPVTVEEVAVEAVTAEPAN